jgi:hypothetical protein
VQALMAQRYTMEIALANPQSVRNAVTNIAAMGLTLNPARKQAYLVPRATRRGEQPMICLDISYMGLVDVAVQSGSVRWAQAELVYAADVFKLTGIDRAPIHERDPFSRIAARLWACTWWPRPSTATTSRPPCRSPTCIASASALVGVQERPKARG